MRIEKKPGACNIHVPENVLEKFPLDVAHLVRTFPGEFPDHGVLFSIPSRESLDEGFAVRSVGFSIDGVAVVLSEEDALALGKALVESFGD